MKKRSIKSALCLLAFAAVLPAHAGLVFAATEIEQQATLGQEKAEAVFKFRNDGDATITIKQLQSSCGCTVPELDKDAYKPGESGEIRALFTFGSRSGKQQKRITVETDDSGERIHNLLFITHIPEWGSLQPQLVRWSLDQEATAKEIRVRVSQPGDISLSEAPETLEHFTIEGRQSGPEEWVFSLVPKSTAARVTERFTVVLSAMDGDKQLTRQLVAYCLVR